MAHIALHTQQNLRCLRLFPLLFFLLQLVVSIALCKLELSFVEELSQPLIHEL